MADDTSNNSPVTSPSTSRAKISRSATAGTVRPRASPTPGSTAEQNGDGRPPTKRARKAINCEPCRNSKLKCDRNRPCSSCVLRGMFHFTHPHSSFSAFVDRHPLHQLGTAAMCYQDGRGHEGSDGTVRGDDHHYSRVDPAQEIARLRHSISLLETYIFPHQRSHLPAARRGSEASNVIPKKELVDPDVSEKSIVAPGLLGSQTQGGLYSGPTSTATHLLINDNRISEETESRQQSQDRTDDASPVAPEYDRDLLVLLPSLEIIDGLINYYFEYCNWIYRHVNQASFMDHWERYKTGSSADRLTLAIACVIMAVATHYLPAQHPLLEDQGETIAERGAKFYDIAVKALARRQEETRTYTLELVELLLIRTHYLVMSKTDSEDIWSLRGELVTIAVAMGLHRDPGKWRMHRDVAERRRWAWWHIILLERWQAFMFGRPLVIASHHFDTQLPSYCDPALDKTGRLYLPNIALFRLAFILGDIMDDAVSVRPVPYESIQANDRALAQWFDSMPQELDMDEYRVARSLASSDYSIRRLGVQSMIIRTSYYHIRFTLHRPYASANPLAAPNSSRKNPSLDAPKRAQSLEIAVNAADKLISMTRSDFLTNSTLAVPGHLNWGPFHCFSAAMFFSFQLIANPDQPGASLFRANIGKAMTTVEHSRGNAVSDRAYDILHALAPLYSTEFSSVSHDVREKQQVQILGTVRKLAFPYQDNTRNPRRYGESPPSSRHNASSPSTSNSLSPPHIGSMVLPHQYEALAQHGLGNAGTSGQNQMPQMATGVLTHPQQSSVAGSSPAGYGSHHHPSTQSPYSSISPQQHSHMPPHHGGGGGASQHQHQQQQVIYAEPTARYAAYVPHPVEPTMWGAAVGFGHSEWNQFLDVMAPEVPASNRHLAPA
ncbi:hypothetical protein BDN72DRAFT_53904 [Pluteus cervinus]|uniref:Uncharacterized protein n=1 Tax=Pluteus cervinus TaxID=181527 RepID=A0ACD3B9X2_9AGAR|nr:hypothetical protein BDN72DRAFT_53904 [Pluteus cervinus]